MNKPFGLFMSVRLCCFCRITCLLLSTWVPTARLTSFQAESPVYLMHVLLTL